VAWAATYTIHERLIRLDVKIYAAKLQCQSGILVGSARLLMSRSELTRFRSLRAIIFGVSSALFALTSTAQSLPNLSHQVWSTEEGLPQSSVHAIAQTTDGYIWAGTEAGLVRFDGIQFKVFDQRSVSAMKSSDICCLVAEDRNGLWIGTRNGLVHRTAQGFAAFDERSGLPSSEIIGLSANPDGSLLVTTSAGSIRWPQSRVVHGTSLTPTWTPQELQPWSSTSTKPLRVGEELPAGRINTVAIDRSGLAWVGMSSGVVLVEPADRPVVTELAAMKGQSVLSILHDGQGNHWLGTESSGLHVFRQLRFHDIPALAQIATTSIAQMVGGDFWIGTRDSGLYRMQNGIVSQPVVAASLTSPIILCLQPTLGGTALWVGTPDGLNLVRSGKAVQKITSVDGLPDDYIRSLAASPDGSVWVGTRHGLDHIQGEKHTVLTSMDGLGGDLIGAMLYDSAGLWIATSGGLSRVGSDTLVRNFTMQDGLPSPIATALARDSSGKLWAATRDGSLSYFDGQRFIPVLRLNQDKDGPQSIQSLNFTLDGSLWIREDRNIRRIRSGDLEGCLSQKPCTLKRDAIIRYSSPDGLRNGETVPTALAISWLTPEGDLWFPTRSGVAVASTLAGKQDTQAPPIVVQQMLIDDVAVDISQVPKLPFGNHRLSIDYAGLDFTSPSGVHYRERLDGFDKDWPYVEHRRSVTYTNLAPGLYTFHVQARTTDGDWSSADTSVSFRILPPFYRRWWFIALGILLAAAILASLFHLRSRVLRHRFEAVLAERNRMAREIHDTLTQDFVSTCLQLDIVAQQLQNNRVDQAIEQVKQARRQVTEGLAEARQSIWELRSTNGSETLPNRLTHLVERDSYAAIKPHLEVRGAYRALEPRIELEILRLAAEALINVARHSGTEQTNIVLYYSTEALMLTIEDFGRGFAMEEAERKAGHFGLIGMKERASVVDGTLEINSVEGKGTIVRLRVPLDASKEGKSL
jgi:signal transduction histidine kinase/ligand-binding sensor domain-containing protein